MDEAKYTMRAIAGGLGKTHGGNPQIGVELVVTQGPNAGERITWYGYFTDKAKEITFRTLRTLGWEGDDLSNLAGIDKNEVTVYVKNEEYQGVWSLKVKGIYPLGGAGLANPMSEAEAKSFAAVMKGDAIASRGNGSSAPKPKAKAERKPAQHADDDIPF
jgi:hypothetical protein